MLGKLIKYEFKACARYFLPLYAALLAIFLINGFTITSGSQNIFTGIMITLLIAIIAIFIFVNLYVTIKRFSTSIFGDEGYLSNTLPVSPLTLMSSKAITMLLYTFISIIVFIVAALLFAAPSASKINIFNLQEVCSGMFTEANKLNISIPLLVFEGFIGMVISTISSTLVLYLSVAVAHLRQCINHKYIYGFLTYFAFNILSSVLSNQLFKNMSRDFETGHNAATQGGQYLVEMTSFMQNVMLKGSLLSLVYIAIAGGLVIYIMSKKLNLE
ncbi:MAG: hypothetical protein RR561_01850 [Peptostreptococcus sp.]|uniref:hypothetical protein n=1 Tax=Peptostreptococcus sp. TaxID=1262 RepID=UPI002FC64D14